MGICGGVGKALFLAALRRLTPTIASIGAAIETLSTALLASIFRPARRAVLIALFA